MTGTTSQDRLGGGAARSRMTVHQLRLLKDSFIEISRRKYQGATARTAVRNALHGTRRDNPIDRARSVAHAEEAPTITLISQLIRLFVAGGTATELLALADVPRQFVLQLTDLAPRSLNHLDLEEQRLSAEEDAQQLRRRIYGPRPEALRAEAATCEALAASLTERALVKRRLADQLERTPELVA